MRRQELVQRPQSVDADYPGVSGVAFTWGSRPDERAARFPCDTLVPDPDVTLFRAITVAAPAALTFRWLCQLRAAPYSYDWLDNGGRQSPRRLTSGMDDLALGQRVMYIFRLADYARDRHLTLTLGGRWARLFGEGAITYRVVATTSEASRIVVKLAMRYPWWGRWRVARAFFAYGDLIMMRKQLRTFKELAEAMMRRECSRMPAVVGRAPHTRGAAEDR